MTNPTPTPPRSAMDLISDQVEQLRVIHERDYDAIVDHMADIRERLGAMERRQAALAQWLKDGSYVL